MEYPYTFVAGTKAVANEVNSNFETVGNQVDTNTNAISDINTNLENKADLSLSNLNETGLDAFANKDAGNFTTTGTTYLSGLGMPSNRYINLTLGASGTTYTAPANGWYAFRLKQNNTSSHAALSFDRIENGVYKRQQTFFCTEQFALAGIVPALKNMTFEVSTNNVKQDTTLAQPTYFCFIYAEGTPSA